MLPFPSLETQTLLPNSNNQSWCIPQTKGTRVVVVEKKLMLLKNFLSKSKN